MNIISAIGATYQSKLSHFRKKMELGLNIIRVKLLKHDNSESVKEYNLFGKRFKYINSYDFLHSLEEIFLEEVYKCSLGETPLIIDCGANIGLSVLYFKRAYPGAKIIAFEPDVNNYELIKQNIESYNLSGVELRKEAVWVKEETLKFKTMGSLGSMIVSGASDDTYDVKAIRLKELLAQEVDMLKMDIEGAEYQVIKDVAPELKNVKNLFLEYHGTFSEMSKLSELFTLLTNSGFSYYIKEALNIYRTPFYRSDIEHPYDVQLNIFCFRT
ncbi:MAG: FkbM family methyltransferase [Flavipsychrobacter sp.]